MLRALMCSIGKNKRNEYNKERKMRLKLKGSKWVDEREDD